jgi:hypothetical protein
MDTFSTISKINAPNLKSEETPCNPLRISGPSYGFPIEKEPKA